MDRGFFANWLSFCRAFSASPSFCVYLGCATGRNRPSLALLSCPRNKHVFRCDQNGPPARRKEGAYPERYVTEEQRIRRPIFIATLWAAASWLFFRVARSSRIDLDMLVARALKNSQLTGGESHAYFGDRTLTSDGTRTVPGASLPRLAKKTYVQDCEGRISEATGFTLRS